MPIVDRVRNICVTPNTEWPVIEREPTTAAELTISYLVPFAALDAIARFIGSTLFAAILPFGRSFVGGFVAGFIGACVSFVMTIVMCFLMAFIINALAPTFGGRQDGNQAFKLTVYSYTPVLVAGLLRIIPVLGGLAAIVAAFYGLYLLYLGLPPMMKAPSDKAPAYTIVIIVCGIVLGFLISIVIGAFAFLGMAGASVF